MADKFASTENMTDLEFVDHWIEYCSDFINPLLFRLLQERGLYSIVNRLSGTKEERKATARARMAKIGRYVGDPEIEEIAGHIDQIKRLQASITQCEPTEVGELIVLLDKIRVHTEFVRNYFNKPAVV